MIECAEVTCFNASAVSYGKPTTTPSATTTSEIRSLRSGRFSRNMSSIAIPSRPAIAALAAVRKVGSKSITATLVAGSDPLKISTPTPKFGVVPPARPVPEVTARQKLVRVLN